MKEIEGVVAKIGGLNLARRIFAAIANAYDTDLQRYHLIPSLSMSGGGKPQVPWGYLLQLAIKHLAGQKPYEDNDASWGRVISLTTAYAAVIDVQPYVPTAFASFNPKGLLQYAQETALYDLMFRLPQLRPSDAVRLCKGLLGFRDENELTPDGWSLGHSLEIIGALFDRTPDIRGPVVIAEMDVRRALPHVPTPAISYVLEQILSHPPGGANQNYSRPTDAPTADRPELGLDFSFKPLLRLSGRRFLMVDRSVCAAACPEAILAALRPVENDLDKKVGLQAERFLEAELATRGVPVHSGDYDVGGDHGECDLVAETTETVVFLELKKKPLTRKARAGGDADLLLDIAGSLLSAQAQAGWHELRLRRAGRLDLRDNGEIYHLDLNGREIERVAVALLDYGSFQDRIFLKHMLETTLGANFSPVDPALNRRFEAINAALQQIRDQVAALHQGKSAVQQPFFHCWFLSLPQILVLLDGVTDPASFRAALWQVRHITTGASDFYFEFSNMKRMKAAAAAERS